MNQKKWIIKIFSISLLFVFCFSTLCFATSDMYVWSEESDTVLTSSGVTSTDQSTNLNLESGRCYFNRTK